MLKDTVIQAIYLISENMPENRRKVLIYPQCHIAFLSPSTS